MDRINISNTERSSRYRVLIYASDSPAMYDALYHKRLILFFVAFFFFFLVLLGITVC